MVTYSSLESQSGGDAGRLGSHPDQRDRLGRGGVHLPRPQRRAPGAARDHPGKALPPRQP